MRLSGRLSLLLWAVSAAAAWAGPGGRDAHVGYLYPAGARQGSRLDVSVGGQFLGGMEQVYVSGEGVRATVRWHVRPLNNLQLGELQKKVRDMFSGRRGAKASPAQAAEEKKSKIEQLPDHPLLNDLEKLSREEVMKRVQFFRDLDSRRKINPQLAEAALLDVTVAPNAAPGVREIRFGTPAGLTNPLRFVVSALPEASEASHPGEDAEPPPVDEPNRPRMARFAGASAPGTPPPPLDVPVVLNGQIMPGDVDRFRLRFRRGQRLVIWAQARSLTPYLADAVPGWFQAVLTLYDSKGREVAYGDDYRFDPDPVLLYEVPEEGEYEVEIRDSIYRGREDFVYRITIGEFPFVTRVFPLGGQAGSKTVATLAGWNLPEEKLTLDTRPEGSLIRQTFLSHKGALSNPVRYAVDTLPELMESEPNNAAKQATQVTLPVTVNGTIGRPGDVDVFKFDGRAGTELVAEVYARRVGSPLDSLLRLIDASGRVVAWNDDHADKESGLLTHHADSYLSAKLPKDGIYYVQLVDSRQQGDDTFGYRLRIGPARPDFALHVTPSGLNIAPSGITPLCVHALRKDGFDGDIELTLKGAPLGFRLDGARIPRGRDGVRITLTVPREQLKGAVGVCLEGHAQIGGQKVTRPVVPADSMMQAFAYNHLVPAGELMVAAAGPGRRAPLIELVQKGPVRVPAGGAARVEVKAPWRRGFQAVQLELSEPPKGVTLRNVASNGDSLAFEVKTDAKEVKPGYLDNLIVEAFVQFRNAGQDNKGANRQKRFSIGVLPAIPFEVVKP